MPYLVYARDWEGMEAQREQVRTAHRDYLRSMGEKLLASGALLDEDGVTVIGGMSLIDADNRSEAEKFADNDPYAKVGIRKETLIVKWRKRWWDGDFLGD